MDLAIVVAMSPNRVIGAKNALPWHLPEDLRQFKKITMGHPMIMGRLTYESIGKPLPGRQSIVVTRDRGWRPPDGVIVAHSLDDAIDEAQKSAAELGVHRAMVIGGANIYAQMIDLCIKLYVTEVHTQVAGDAYFPVINTSIWREKYLSEGYSGTTERIRYKFKEFVRSC